MGCLQTLVIAGVTAITSVWLAGFAGDVATRAVGVSDFEGGRGYLVVLGLAPLGGLAGLLIGAAAARVGPWRGPAALLTRLSTAVATAAAAIGVVAGLAIASVGSPPQIDGRTLDLQMEIRLAAGVAVPETHEDLRVAFQTSASDNRYVAVNFDAIRLEGGQAVVPASTGLLSRASRSWLVVTASDGLSQVIDLPLEAEPGAEHLSWSAWIPASRAFDAATVDASRAHAARFRVVMSQD